MKQGESITDYFGRVMTVANDMRNYGEDVDDVKIVEKILRTLAEKWNYIFKGSGEDEHVLKVTHEERYGGRGRGRAAFRGGRGQGRGRGSQPMSKETVECYKCHKLGHFQYECQANYAGLEESEEMVLMAYVDTLEDDRNVEWYIDSGCSNHMCGDSSLFCELEEGFNKVVRFGNYASMNVVGKGSVRLTVKGVNHLVRDVYYVPGLKNNLLSVGQLQERGLAVLMKSNECRIYHDTKGLVFQTNMTANQMFVLLSSIQSFETSSSKLKV
ncbi:uncharacterized protein [Cicer arietinum]|uniref:uncharacterized protein n=1 Tax=Cicer arietinum TaxID=3827 RepID=UPI003CC6399E